MLFGYRLMAHGSRLMAHDSWLMAHDSWLMAHGSWLTIRPSISRKAEFVSLRDFGGVLTISPIGLFRPLAYVAPKFAPKLAKSY